jgi:hypothetical protein
VGILVIRWNRSVFLILDNTQDIEQANKASTTALSYIGRQRFSYFIELHASDVPAPMLDQFVGSGKLSTAI